MKALFPTLEEFISQTPSAFSLETTHLHGGQPNSEVTSNMVHKQEVPIHIVVGNLVFNYLDYYTLSHWVTKQFINSMQ
jgi:hypothetical protein